MEKPMLKAVGFPALRTRLVASHMVLEITGEKLEYHAFFPRAESGFTGGSEHFCEWLQVHPCR
jgi:hypothetical protein